MPGFSVDQLAVCAIGSVAGFVGPACLDPDPGCPDPSRAAVRFP